MVLKRESTYENMILLNLELGYSAASELDRCSRYYVEFSQSVQANYTSTDTLVVHMLYEV